MSLGGVGLFGRRVPVPSDIAAAVRRWLTLTESRRLWLGIAGYTVSYLVAVVLGRLTVTTDLRVALVWPAAGVGFVWFGWLVQRGHGWRSVPFAGSASLVLVGSVLMNLASGAAPTAALAYAVANLLIAVVSGVTYVRWCGVDHRGLQTRRGLNLLVASAVVGSTCGAVVGATAVWALTGASSTTTVWQWILRNTVSIVIVGSPILLWLNREEPRLVDRSARREAIGVFVSTALSCEIVIGIGVDRPLIVFLLVPVSVWAASTYTVWMTTCHILVVATVIVVSTVINYGPFASDDPWTSMAVAQSFLMVLAYSTLNLAIERDLRNRTNELMAASRRASQSQSYLLDTLIATMREGVIVVDARGVAMYCNDAALDLLGINVAVPGSSGSGAAGRSVRDQVLSEDPDGAVQRALRGEDVRAFDVSTPDGGRVLSVQARPLVHDGGAQVLVIVTDVTTERRQTKQLASFAGTVAHDLRSPLTAVSLWAQMLEEELVGAGPDVDTTPIQRIHTSAARMQALITDLLRHSLAGDSEVTTRPVDLGALVGDVVAVHLQAGADRGVAPSIDVDVHHMVEAEPGLIRQVLDNLIGNAVKYVAPGVPAQVRIASERQAGGVVSITVADRGIGLPAGEEERVFEEFHRVPQLAGAYPGTGLGLSISRRIVERHGGRIWAARRDGGGSSFTFTLPSADPETPAAPDALEAPLVDAAPLSGADNPADGALSAR